jgi:hypothetical protein
LGPAALAPIFLFPRALELTGNPAGLTSNADMTTALGGHDRCIDHACWPGWRKKPNSDLPIVVAARLPDLVDLDFGARIAPDARALLRYA